MKDKMQEICSKFKVQKEKKLESHSIVLISSLLILSKAYFILL